MTVEEIFAAALALPAADRLRLAGELLAETESPCPEPRGEAYLAEIQRRSADTDPASWMPADEAFRRIHERLGIRGPSDV